MAFNPREWHHLYLGIPMMVASFFWGGYWLAVPGIIITADDLAQHFLGVEPSPFKILYAYTLYQYPCVQRFNRWLDHLFGKEE